MGQGAVKTIATVSTTCGVVRHARTNEDAQWQVSDKKYLIHFWPMAIGVEMTLA